MLIRLFIAALALWVTQCAPSKGVIGLPYSEVRPAADRTASKVGLKMDTVKQGSADTILFKDRYGNSGWLVLQDSSNSQTFYESSMKTGALHPKLFEDFFIGCVQQEALQARGEASPIHNERKSYFAFIGRNLITPAWGTYYVTKGNPLLPKWVKTTFITSNILMEALAVALVAGGITADEPNAITSGIGLAGLFRVLGCSNLTYLGVYNRYAHLEYDFNKIKVSF